MECYTTIQHSVLCTFAFVLQDKNALRMRTGVAMGNWWIQGTCGRKKCIKPERSISKQWISLGWGALEDAAVCKTSNMQDVRANAISSKRVPWIHSGPLIHILHINSFLSDDDDVLISQICHLWYLWRCCDPGKWDDERRRHDRCPLETKTFLFLILITALSFLSYKVVFTLTVKDGEDEKTKHFPYKV